MAEVTIHCSDFGAQENKIGHYFQFCLCICHGRGGWGVRFSSVTQSCPTLGNPWTAACQVSLSITSSRSLLKLTSIESMMPSISSSVVPFSHLQSFPASGSFQMSQFFTSGGLSTGVGCHCSQLQLFSISGWGIDLDYCDIEWFALEMNRDHSVIFETAPKYCILDSLLTMRATPFLLRDSCPQ